MIWCVKFSRFSAHVVMVLGVGYEAIYCWEKKTFLRLFFSFQILGHAYEHQICAYLSKSDNLKLCSKNTWIQFYSGWVSWGHSIPQFSSVTQSYPTPCNPMNGSTLGLPVHHQLPDLLKLMPIESVMPSSHLILCCSLLLLPPIPPSIRVFSNESTLRMRWPKYWSFSLSISPSNEHPGLISLGWTGWISLQSKGLSRVFSNTTVQKHQFFSIQLSSQSTLISIHDHWKNHSLDQMDFCWQSNVSAF